MFAAHQMGTCRMGRDPKTSVARPCGELHDTPGVWIGDASCVPDPLGDQPDDHDHGARPPPRIVEAAAKGTVAAAAPAYDPTGGDHMTTQRADAHVRDRIYIGGEWVASSGSGTIEVINATTEEVMGSVPEGTAQDVDRAVAAARAAFESWSQTPSRSARS